MTPFQSHVKLWKDCRLCGLCSQRSRVVLFRGSVPCDMLFVGEAPGMSEDALGVPFTGPAGKLLDRIIEMATAATQVPGTQGSSYNSLRWGFTNLVACFPRDNKETENHAPPEEAIRACAGRLREIVRVCKPRLIVLVGRLSKKYVSGASQFALKSGQQPEWIEEGRYLEFIEIEHPAFILRSNAAVQGLMIKKCVVVIRSAVEKL